VTKRTQSISIEKEKEPKKGGCCGGSKKGKKNKGGK